MRTPIEALKEIRDRLTYFCLRTDGKYDPPWATELVGIIDDIIKYKKNTDNPFYVDIGTSVVAIRCSSNHDVVHWLDHVYRKGSIDYLEQMCARMNEEALGLQKQVNAAALREALESASNWCLNRLGNASYQVTVEGLLSVVDAALSSPPRNCDVGTAQEQAERFGKLCAGQADCVGCPCNKGGGIISSDCFAKWAQMPYAEEGGAK